MKVKVTGNEGRKSRVNNRRESRGNERVRSSEIKGRGSRINERRELDVKGGDFKKVGINEVE